MDVVKSQRSILQRSTSNTGSSSATTSRRGRSLHTKAIMTPQHQDKPIDNDGNSSSPAQPEEEGATDKLRGGPFQRLRRRRRHSAPARTRRKRLLVEDHYRVELTETKQRVVLPGVPKHDDDWITDSHDFFNLIVLIPVVALNVINWNWEMILSMPKNRSVEDAWTGDFFDLFFGVTVLYFLIDLMWVIIIPSCVKSPWTIIQHHVAAMIYILIPHFHPEFRCYMGACMMVEINTWLLIARRVFNKQGFPPWILKLSFVSIRVKLISIFFYLTWISIRCLLYPYLLWPLCTAWLKHSAKVGTKFNIVMLCVPLHACFCVLNLKWTYDLLMSKIRYWRRRGNWKEASKGL
uniref:TLC domain-containing protein n=1 Tax=Amphora coffeiformis TaxID=265554 RepID=A0A7S3P3F3_9STRA|mmetsp:Transcript_11053/g.22650  ORF Transcript_11053/g.22650 Transcript_11053/m.22650 type:complete len:349 (+) Transcript_11053:289-1335(+)